MSFVRTVVFVLLVTLANLARLPADDEFFETKVRPVLVQHCVSCHGPAKQKGGLRLDNRAAVLTGGDSGPAVVPGNPAASRLIDAVRYGNVDLQMPPKGKLAAATIADLERWVKDGAPWPNDTAPTATTRAEFDLAARKQTHWSWQPVTHPAVPTVRNPAWVADPVDAFVLAKLDAKNLHPAPPADKPTWLRRVTFALTGLPPAPADLAAFLADTSPAAHETVVDRLLASPAFGERWGRHWLDLVRYAETRGHEFDPDIPNAWRYRDYIVRALNADVPYDQLVREHLAGDCLPAPRLDPLTGANESIVGTAFWHLGEEVHSPVDLRQDQADRLDNRIDVMTKAFLGLTVSCARCHDHKFDAISTKDYYALYGLLEGSGYRQVRTDGWATNRKVAAELATLRERTRVAVPHAPELTTSRTPWLANARVVVDYTNLKPGEWLPDDVTFGPGPTRPGTVILRGAVPYIETRTAAAFDPFWAGLSTDPASKTDGGALAKLPPRAGFTIRTPNFVLERDRLYYLVRGGGGAYAAVNGHTIIHGPLHGKLVSTFPDAADYRWVAHDLSGYRGQRLHVELTADPRTAFAVALVIQADTPPPPVPTPRLNDPAPIRPEIATELAAAEKELAARVAWQSRLVPALLDGTAVDERVFVRGNPRSLGDVVPHRSLEALAGPERLVHPTGSGRLELARQLTDPARNPYIARVVVNRVWHHLFGRGLVASTDNFGVLGEAPTHPELLDHLASTFTADGWSFKRLIRRLTLSNAYRMSSREHPATDAADPGNLLLHRFRLQRLEGEAIRDALLAVSGELKPDLGGPPVPIYLTPFLDGRGRPATGPLDGNGRRSLYLAARRNFLSPFLIAFDTPTPFSTVGRRQVSNVPAQSLILMNDPFVHQQTEAWAKRVAAGSGTITDQVRRMYETAYGRPPTDAEATACREAVGRGDPAAWADLAHALVLAPEFVFVR